VKSALFVGEIEHRRLSPVKNEFTYSVCYYYLDLDEVEKLFRFPFIFSYNFPGVLSFWRKDYLSPKNVSLKTAVCDQIFGKTGKKFDGSVRVLSNISYFGYCFNPVSFYYCFDREERLCYIVSQVTNTPWRERHVDVFEIKGNKPKHLYHFPKEFHVSPFMPMNIDYTWIFNTPDEKLYVHMQNRHTGGSSVVFDSTLTLKRRELSFWSILLHSIRFPLVTFKTTLAIYFQAAILYFIKRIPFYTHPKKLQVQKEKVT